MSGGRNSRADMFRENAREDKKRYKKGPICGLCSKSPFTAKQIPQIGQVSFGIHGHCDSRDIAITPESGRRCTNFSKSIR